MRTATLVITALVVVPLETHAAPEPTDTHITLERHALPANGNVGQIAQSRIIYLNHTGITLYPGDDDSRTNHSSIVSRQSMVPAWNTSSMVWAATVACMQDMFNRWDVTVTDVDPGGVPHIEAVFGGSPQNVGLQQGVGGVSPFTHDCGIIENSIVFTFTSVFPNNAQTVCEVMSQEVAHSFGLDHEMLASDPMTYLDYNGNRSFKDQTVSCGEYQNRPCGIGGSSCRPKQNSVQLLTERLGLADTVAPTLAITFPSDGAVLPPGFTVQAIAADNVAVTRGTLYIDDLAAGMTQGAGPFSFATDSGLAEGSHTVAVEVTDGHNPKRQTISITVKKGARPEGSGSGSGGAGDGGPGDGASGDDGSLLGGCAATRGDGWLLGVVFVLWALASARRRDC